LRGIVTLCLALGACAAHAQEDGMTIGLHLASAHSAGRMNSSNPGLYLRLPSGFTAGFYENSLSRTRYGGNDGSRRYSTYAGWTWQSDNRTWALGLGGVTGYGRDEQEVCVERPEVGNGCARFQHLDAVPAVVPMALLSGRWSITGGWAARLGYTVAPGVAAGDRFMHVLTLMTERSF
jgi:hypothetical protein